MEERAVSDGTHVCSECSTYEDPAPTMKTSVSKVSTPSSGLLGDFSSRSSSGWSTKLLIQVDRTHIFHERASLPVADLTGKRTNFPAQLSLGELVRKDISQSINISPTMSKLWCTLRSGRKTFEDSLARDSGQRSGRLLRVQYWPQSPEELSCAAKPPRRCQAWRKYANDR